MLAIEWAEKLREAPDGTIRVRIEHGEEDRRRIAILQSSQAENWVLH